MEEEDYESAALDELIGSLDGARRRARQEAAHRIALLAQVDSEPLIPHVRTLKEALWRPEAQTRWEVFDALSHIADTSAELVSDAYEAAEASLFDEDSAIVRLAAFRFLTRYGQTDPLRSDEVWPILDEAIQCYHGDPEYHDMLLALLDLARGKLSDATREALVARVSFDAENGRSYIKAYSIQIVSAAEDQE